MAIRPRARRNGALCPILVALLFAATPAAAQLSSYATSATDLIGSTGAAAVAVGVPDYQFVNDAGLGFGGTSTDVFDVGESIELAFPTPLRNNALQEDLIVYAFVGGLGATDNANVQVEVSSDGANFVVIDTFDTEEARSFPFPDSFENDFEAVKHFRVEFGTEDLITHVRLTNLAGTTEGLRLDAVEGLWPVVSSAHAFEVRIERVREDTARRFKIRLKNVAQPGGVPIREWIMDRTGSLANLEDTDHTLQAADGSFICVENCVMDNYSPPQIPYSRHVWSADGTTEAPTGVGLEPGRQAAHFRYEDFDTDGGLAYLSGFQFTVVFADGLTHTFDYDADVTKEIGSLYQKYLYFSPTPAQSWNRPVDYYEFASSPPPVPSIGPLGLGCLGALAMLTGLAGARRTHRASDDD